MKSNKILALMLAAVLAAGSLGLAACGGGGSSSGGDDAKPTDSQQEKTPAGPTDEELIKEDLEKVVGFSVSKEEMLEGFLEDEDMKHFQELGFDLEAYAENMSNKIKFDVRSIDVSGDTAVAHVTLTFPEFNEAAEALIEKRADEAFADIDLESITEEEFLAKYMGVVSDTLTDPAFPTVDNEFDIDYVKKGDAWEMADQSEVESQLEALSDAAA